MPGSNLVLDRDDGAVRMHLHDIGPPGEVQTLGPQRDAPQHGAPAFPAARPAVHTLMPAGTTDRVRVVRPQSVRVDQRALARTVLVVFERRERERGGRFHHQTRSEAYARVTSEVPAGMNGTLR